DQASARRHGADVLLQIGATDDVEYDIRVAVLFLDDCREIICPVVDGGVCTQVEAERSLLVAAAGGNDLGAKRLGKLDRRRPDAARAAVHQHGLAGLKSCEIEDVRPYGDDGFHQASAILKRDVFWKR